MPQQIGEERYKKQMLNLKRLGMANQFLPFENVIGVPRFVDLYHDEYCSHRLVTHSAMLIRLPFIVGRATASTLRIQKVSVPVLRIYNGNSKRRPNR